MSNEKALPINDNNNKPSQDDKPTNEQRPMGTQADLDRNARQTTEKEDNDTNSVGIREKQEGSGSDLG